MKKLFAFTLLMAMPASASVVVTSPVAVNGSVATASSATHQWVQAPLQTGGYARCINPNGCRNGYAPFDQSVAGYNQVYQGVVFDGWSAGNDGNPPVKVLVVFRLGSANLPYSGIYTRADDWQGVS